MKSNFGIFCILGGVFALAAANAAVIATPAGTSVAALAGDTAPAVADYVTPFSYNTMYPFMTDQMRERLYPGDTNRAPNTAAVFSQVAAAGTGITPVATYTQSTSNSGQFNAATANAGAGRTVSQRAVSARSAMPMNAPVQADVLRTAANPAAGAVAGAINPNITGPVVFGPGTMSSGMVANAARAAANQNPGMLPAGAAATSTGGGLPSVAAQQQRGVVARAAAPIGTMAAAPMGTPTASNPNTAHAAMMPNAVPAYAGMTNNNAAANRQVVARAAMFTNYATTQQNNANANTNNFVPNVGAAQCLADYTTCMDSYCRHDDTLYNRCYCSPKLAQIDGQFQPAINAAVTQIVTLKNGGSTISDAEMEQIWADTFSGNASGGNSLADLNAALTNIDWSDMENTTRGQNAFVTGDQYCAQHLAGCYYMAQNMRDVYRSQITRDCAAYQDYLDRLKTAAESAVAQLGGTVPNNQ